jgi:hypothetical protein
MSELLANVQWLIVLLWIGLAFFTLGLAVLLYTRWGQYKPLRKCMGLSLLAHLLLAGYATTIQIVYPVPRPPGEPAFRVALGEDGDRPILGTAEGGATVPEIAKAPERPWELFVSSPLARSDDKQPRRMAGAEPLELVRPLRLDDVPPLLNPTEVETADSPAAQLTTPAGPIGKQVGLSPERIERIPPQRREAANAPFGPANVPGRLTDEVIERVTRPLDENLPAALIGQLAAMQPLGSGNAEQPMSELAALGGWGASRTGNGTPGRGTTGRTSSLAPEGGPSPESRQPVPGVYRLRVEGDHTVAAQSRGGSAETEAAVKLALKWLAANQSADGRWDPRIHVAGKETNTLGRDRQGAGSRADSAITGLALLAFLGSGHTHLDGQYKKDVQRGLEYLLRTQAADGNLAGQAAPFEFMYAHAMAACAISEAYGMTHDARLREPVTRAIGYTIAAQDPVGGGWRYRPGDQGDTSQLGWQLMALKSAELAGIPMPEKTRQGIVRFLRSVSSGQAGGLASYRPGEKVTSSMTAEALVCWQWLGLAREHPACDEAGQHLLGRLPGSGEYNLYYWYYGTLGMYQLQGRYWQGWNDSMLSAVMARQIKQGPLAGSWDTSDLWGGYGGRVYTTALATLILEVYYRFLPLYAEVARDGRQMR